MNMNDHDEPEVPGLRQLPMRRAPASDLWPGIEARLKPRRRVQPTRYLAAAACVLAVLGGAVGLNLRGTTAPAPQGATQVADATPASGTTVRVKPRRVPSAADTRGLLRANLRVIEASDRQIRAAQKYDPDSSYLASLLETNRKQQHKLREMLEQQT